MTQNFSNHRRFSKPFHFFLIPVTLIAFIYSLFQLFAETSSINVLVSLLFLLVLLSSVLARTSALKAQDRAIINEVKLRYFMISGKPIHDQVKRSQLIALRFASDAELVELTQKSVDENLSASAIKKSIKIWKPDYNRV